MFRLFPNQEIQVTEFRNYTSFNGVLSVFDYNPLAFNSHLLVGLNENGNLMSLSFSFSKGERLPEEKHTIFSLNIYDDSLLHITFNANQIYYSDKIKIDDELLNNFNKVILSIYSQPALLSGGLNRQIIDPTSLLADINSCAIIHSEIIEAHAGSRESIHQNIPLFIELLTHKLNAELERLLNAEKQVYHAMKC